jgi:serine O-acetyltransferase
LQESPAAADFCSDWQAALSRKEQAADGSGAEHGKDSALWRTIRREAEADARAEPLLSSFLYASILSHESFERSLAFVLANRLSDATLLSTELFEVFYTVLRGDRRTREASLADLCAVRERDPACASYSQAILYFKGFHALQVQRIAHRLWHQGRRVMAVALQSRASEVFAVDIHPAARLGKGVLLDHGTGVVIGETAEVGDNVSILQNVTLGGTGKQHGDRHPKVSDNVLIGASATILGNIRIGRGAQVAAGSLVLKPVPPRTMVAGSPAKEVGTVTGNPAAKMEQWNDLAMHDARGGEAAPAAAKAAEAACDDPFLPSSPPPAAAAKPGGAAATPAAAPQAANGHAAEAAKEEDAKGVVELADAPPAPAAQVAPARAKQGGEAPRRGPPAASEPVEAVTSDVAAKKKWGDIKSDDMDYFI